MLGPGGHKPPKSCPAPLPKFNTGQLDTVVLLLVDVIGSIVISLSSCCLPNDERPGPQIYFPRAAPGCRRSWKAVFAGGRQQIWQWQVCDSTRRPDDFTFTRPVDHSASWHVGQLTRYRCDKKREDRNGRNNWATEQDVGTRRTGDWVTSVPVCDPTNNHGRSCTFSVGVSGSKGLKMGAAIGKK